jgi:hypothetical protein
MIKHPMRVFNRPVSAGPLPRNAAHDLECLDTAKDDECVEPKEKSASMVYAERTVGGRHVLMLAHVKVRTPKI